MEFKRADSIIKTEINGVSLRGDAARVSAQMRRAQRKVLAVSAKILVGRATSFTLSLAVRYIKSRFDAAFGKGAAEKIFKSSNSLYDCISAVRFVIGEVSRYDEKFAKACEKYDG